MVEGGQGADCGELVEPKTREPAWRSDAGSAG